MNPTRNVNKEKCWPIFLPLTDLLISIALPVVKRRIDEEAADSEGKGALDLARCPIVLQIPSRLLSIYPRIGIRNDGREGGPIRLRVSNAFES